MLPLAPNVPLSFDSQVTGSYLASLVEPAAYGYQLDWDNDPAMPQGTYTANLKVSYPTDPDWPAGTVTKAVPFLFERGSFPFLIYVPNWDCQAQYPHTCFANDEPIPWVVSPGAPLSAFCAMRHVRC